ncbi:MAG: M4 family metallopeptidase [Acidobacteriota bacterium]
MTNITPEQEKLLSHLRQRDVELEVHWDEVRGVAGSVRGRLEPAPPAAARATPQQRMRGFLRQYGALFGPPGLPPEALVLLRTSTDELGWTHLVYQHTVQVPGQRKPIEVYGAKLAAHFDGQGALIEVQSSLWRDLRVTAKVRVTAAGLRALQSKRLQGVQGYAALCDRLERQEKLLPLTDPPRLVVYPWKQAFPLVWATYGYGVAEEAQPGEKQPQPAVTFGQLFVDSTTGEQLVFAPTLQTAETQTTGSGLAVTPLAGSKTSRTLNVVREGSTNTYRLKDLTHNRNIVTYDAACSTSYNQDSEIEPAIKNGTLPVSEDTDGDHNWNREPGGTVTRTDAQLPEVDAHHFVRVQYEWYNALAGAAGRAGWDDGKYSNPPAPNQTLNVIAHCYPPDAWSTNCTTFNAYKWSRKSGGVWTFWLSFMDGSGTAYDYAPGSRFIVAHEYQHAITDFSFEDGNGNPGLTYSGWFGAVHEGLSDVFGGLSSEDWLPCREVSHLTPAQIFRNLVYPRDTACYDPSKLDHFADRNVSTGFYERGTILAHCAHLMGKGGVHQRTSRSPVLIPVYALGRDTVSGVSFLKAARIWYRALSHYFSTHGNLTGIPTNDENTFRTLRDGCVSAAVDLYGSGSVEHRTTILAFYAVGLHPASQNYGADVTLLRWGVSWDLSRAYVGLTSPNYSSLDVFINNGGASEWNAVINVVDPATGQPTQYENTIYCRVRNVGDQPANGVEVTFQYAKAGTATVTWLDVKDKNGNTVKLTVGTLAAGQSNFADSAQNSPPASAGVKWCIPPLASGEVVDHFCLKAKVTASNDVNPHNNEAQSNIAYTDYSPAAPATAVFLVGNPFKKKRIPIDLKVQAALPKGWKARIVEDLREKRLKPGEELPFTVAIETPAGADREMEPPLDGDLRGHLYGDVAGPFTGSLTDTTLEGGELRGRMTANLPHIGAVVGIFSGSVDLHTGQISGRLLGSSPCPKRPDQVCLGVEACLRPWRRVDISQWHEGELIGGVTVQVQVPFGKGPCKLELPPTGTKVIPGTRTPESGGG